MRTRTIETFLFGTLVGFDKLDIAQISAEEFEQWVKRKSFPPANYLVWRERIEQAIRELRPESNDLR